MTAFQDPDFVRIRHHLSRHPALSLMAIGLATHILSLPDGSPVDIISLAARFPESRARVASALRELETHGYLDRRPTQDGGGRWVTVTVAYADPATPRDPHTGAPGPTTACSPEPAPDPARTAAPAEPAPDHPKVPAHAPQGPAPAAGTPAPGPEEPVPAAVSAAPAASAPITRPPSPHAPAVPPPAWLSSTAHPDTPTSAPQPPPPPPPGPVPPAPIPAPRRRAAPPPPLPRPAHPTPDLLRAAADVLGGLQHADPRLLLSARDADRLAPAAATWLERGATPAGVHHALTGHLPTLPLHHPPAFLAHRLTVGLPPLPAPTPPPPGPPPPLQTCEACDRAFRSPAPGTCRDCRPTSQETALR